MATPPRDPRIGLRMLVHHVGNLVKYFDEGRVNARGMRQEFVHGSLVPGATLDGPSVLRCYGAEEAFATVVDVLKAHEAKARAPFSGGETTPSEAEALARLKEVLFGILADALEGPKRELSARRTLLNGLEPGVAEAVDPEIAEALARAISAEWSQRLVALETITATVAACVKAFFELYPEVSRK